jgi:hypothetical protein
MFAWLSLLLFYDLYRELAPHLQSTASSFAFNVVILLIPTTLMGLSLPLVARAVTATADDAGAVVGHMYGINTLGAAAPQCRMAAAGQVRTRHAWHALHLIAADSCCSLSRLLRNPCPTGGTCHDHVPTHPPRVAVVPRVRPHQQCSASSRCSSTHRHGDAFNSTAS